MPTRLIELAQCLSSRTHHPEALLWLAWLVAKADCTMSDDRAVLTRHLVADVRDQHGVVEANLAQQVEVDVTDVWERLMSEEGALNDIVAAARCVAECEVASTKRRATPRGDSEAVLMVPSKRVVIS